MATGKEWYRKISTARLLRGVALFVVVLVAISASSSNASEGSCPSYCPEVADATCMKKCNTGGQGCYSPTVPKACKSCPYGGKCTGMECYNPKGHTRVECRLLGKN